MAIEAVQHVRAMRGGAQSHLMRCSDQHYYVVKFQNNPQHVRVLANELLATRMAAAAGLTVPACAIVMVDPWLIENTSELRVNLGRGTESFKAGHHFGSRYAVDPVQGQAFDYLADETLRRVKNLDEFAGMLAFDKWTCNANGRQAVFCKLSREKTYTAMFVDQGYCFNAGEWSFPDSPLRGIYPRNQVYEQVTGWAKFEPWLGRIEQMPSSVLNEIADEIPPEWYGQMGELKRLIEALGKRRGRVKELITDFKKSTREPFPRWKD